MKHTIKVDNIPLDYWRSSTLYDIGDWLQFFNDKFTFPYKIVGRRKRDNKHETIYTYKLG